MSREDWSAYPNLLDAFMIKEVYVYIYASFTFKLDTFQIKYTLL